MLPTLLFYSLIGGVFSLAGGFLLLWKHNLVKKFSTTLLSFAAGAFLGVAFLDLLPEVLETDVEPHLILSAALTGFISFYILERFLMTSFFKHTEEKDHSDHTETLPTLLILGDSIHNFLDGIVIALAFVANPSLGLITTIAIAAHEIPQEIGDFSILLNQGWNKRKVILVNIMQSLLTIPGVLLGFYAGGLFETQLPFLLAGAAGIFIYISASDLIPEIHHKAGHNNLFRVILPLLIGILTIGYLTGIAH